MALGALGAAVLLLLGLNLLADPFGVFGDPILSWPGYTMTLNPRISKPVWLSERFDRFDGYIVGSSTASAIPPQVLERYLGGACYNAFHYGCNWTYDEALTRYILEHDGDVRYIFLVLGINDARVLDADNGTITDRFFYPLSGESKVSFYGRMLTADPRYALEKLSAWTRDTVLPQTFDVFIPEDGTYDKRVRDVESIGALGPYLADHGEDFPQENGPWTIEGTEDCLRHVAAIRDMCEEKGVALYVMMAPACQEQLQLFDPADLTAYYEALSREVSWWNFQITPLRWDDRYFYDISHFRNATAEMCLRAMFGDETGYLPEPFGVCCPRGEAPKDAETLLTETGPQDHTKTVPILIYHHLTDDPAAEESDTVLHVDKFARQMSLLRQEGFTPVSLQAMEDYVYLGTDLPENPVAITFDDGYLSNYALGYPILRDYGFPATIFAIGCSVGHYDFYKDTDNPIVAHFGEKEMAEMTGSGLISVQSHTYDMHQTELYDPPPVRSSICPFPGEKQEDYLRVLAADAEKQAETFTACGIPAPTALAFPGGDHETVTDVGLRAAGYRITLTTDSLRTNTLVRGLPQSLIDLGRMNIGGVTTDEEILNYLRYQLP